MPKAPRLPRSKFGTATLAGQPDTTFTTYSGHVIEAMENAAFHMAIVIAEYPSRTKLHKQRLALTQILRTIKLWRSVGRPLRVKESGNIYQ